MILTNKIQKIIIFANRIQWIIAMNRLLVVCLLAAQIVIFGCASPEAEKEGKQSGSTPSDSILAPIPENPSSPEEEMATVGNILITADESLKPIIGAAINGFHIRYPRANIQARYLPGDQAIREMLTNDSVRLVISSRHLVKEEVAVLERRHLNPVYSTILKDGITLLANHKRAIKKLNLEQLQQVLTGEIQTWNQLNPEETEDPIFLVFDHAESSTIRFLQDSLLNGQELKSERFAVSPSPAVIDYVREQDQALGIIGVSWLSDRDDPRVKERKKGIRMLQLERQEQDTLCTDSGQYFGPYQSFLYQGCYPLTRSIHTILRESSHGLGTGFVSYLYGIKGQRLIHKSGLSTIKGIPRRVKLPPKEGARSIDY